MLFSICYVGILGQLDDMLDMLKKIPLKASSLEIFHYIAFEQNTKLLPHIHQKLRRLGFQQDISNAKYERRMIVGEREITIQLSVVGEDVTSKDGIEALYRILDKQTLTVDMIIGQYVFYDL